MRKESGMIMQKKYINPRFPINKTKVFAARMITYDLLLKSSNPDMPFHNAFSLPFTHTFHGKTYYDINLSVIYDILEFFCKNNCHDLQWAPNYKTLLFRFYHTYDLFGVTKNNCMAISFKPKFIGKKYIKEISKWYDEINVDTSEIYNKQKQTDSPNPLLKNNLYSYNTSYTPLNITPNTIGNLYPKNPPTMPKQNNVPNHKKFIHYHVNKQCADIIRKNQLKITGLYQEYRRLGIFDIKRKYEIIQEINNDIEYARWGICTDLINNYRDLPKNVLNKLYDITDHLSDLISDLEEYKGKFKKTAFAERRDINNNGIRKYQKQLNDITALEEYIKKISPKFNKLCDEVINQYEKYANVEN